MGTVIAAVLGALAGLALKAVFGPLDGVLFWVLAGGFAAVCLYTGTRSRLRGRADR